MKKILKILFAIMAPAWLAFSCAHAEEVSVTVPVTYGYTAQSTQAYYLNQYVSDSSVLAYGGSYWGGSDLIIGSSSQVPLPSTPYYVYDNDNYVVNIGNIRYNKAGEVYNPSYATDFQVSFDDLFITLDMTGQLNGYYRYEGYVLLGLAYSGANIYYSQATYDFNPSYTYSSVPLAIGDSESGMHCIVYLVGDISYDHVVYQSSKVTNHMVKLYVESTFLYDSSYGTDITFDLSSVFGTMLSTFSVDFSTLRAMGGSSTYGYVFYNNRFCSTVYGNVEPPVTPTPSPTPSPNQDIINNSNTNTTNIITTINDGFDALSAVFEGSIYGLTDLFFGSASDWIDFFSDVQDDMEDYLPVVSFFQSCKNILANFFNVESTDPTALQFVAGWQSDIYTLHIGALPLVLPEGTYNFFPEVNFDLNNPFMNEIRPYWLTFSNVLITLLFLRYLANYLFRWTQLLTGDTSVAFQLFHHAPDELENLGTDPYDLAGDYSYDSIDSANHDLYQDAEAHYGHGAARYLSKVFHSK